MPGFRKSRPDPRSIERAVYLPNRGRVLFATIPEVSPPLPIGRAVSGRSHSGASSSVRSAPALAAAAPRVTPNSPSASLTSVYNSTAKSSAVCVTERPPAPRHARRREGAPSWSSFSRVLIPDGCDHFLPLRMTGSASSSRCSRHKCQCRLGREAVSVEWSARRRISAADRIFRTDHAAARELLLGISQTPWRSKHGSRCVPGDRVCHRRDPAERCRDRCRKSVSRAKCFAQAHRLGFSYKLTIASP